MFLDAMEAAIAANEDQTHGLFELYCVSKIPIENIIVYLFKMIEFNSNVDESLPYNRQHYIDFLDDGAESSIKWYGVSFQLPHAGGGKQIRLKEFVETYESLFKNVITMLDNGSSWIVNHDDKDLDWFLNDGDNLTQLRSLFKQSNIPNTLRGALIFSTEDLLECYRDLISYPYAAATKEGFLYKNLDISHREVPVIIKVSGHLNIDFLSTDKAVISEIINENSSSLFIVIEYRGNGKQ
jgi:hypothetical protein